MDTLSELRKIIRGVLEPYTKIEYAYLEAENKLVWDEEGDHYLIVSSGWDTNPKRRVHGCLIHLDIIDGKVWVQRDGTEDGVAAELEDAGIPKSQIVLGFHPPNIRQHTDYAAA